MLMRSGIRVFFLVSMMAVMTAQAGAGVLDERRDNICRKASVQLMELESAYRAHSGVRDADIAYPGQSVAAAVAFQREVFDMASETDAVETVVELGTTLPFAISNIFNDMLVLKYLRSRPGNHSGYLQLAMRYAQELGQNIQRVKESCGDSFLPAGVRAEAEKLIEEAQERQKDFGGDDRVNQEKCFRECEDGWKEILGPLNHLVFLIEVAKCKNSCLQQGNR